MDKHTSSIVARVVVWLCLGAAAIASPATAQVPRNEIKLAWALVPGATGYRVDYGTATLDYSGSTNVAAATQATVSLPADAVSYYLAVKAYNLAGESMGWSREVVGWPRPEISAIDVQCEVLAAGLQECVAAVSGYNFGRTITAAIPYAGITVIQTVRANSRSILVSFAIDPEANVGVANLVLQQAWTVTPGTQLPGDDGVTGGMAGPTFPGALTVGAAVVLPAPQNPHFVD